MHTLTAVTFLAVSRRAEHESDREVVTSITGERAVARLVDTHMCGTVSVQCTAIEINGSCEKTVMINFLECSHIDVFIDVLC